MTATDRLKSKNLNDNRRSLNKSKSTKTFNKVVNGLKGINNFSR